MFDVLIAGAGPAGLFAAERLSQKGYRVVVIDRMPSPARKFLMAGRGGLNLVRRAGRRNLCWQQWPGVSKIDEGLSPAARLAAPA